MFRLNPDYGKVEDELPLGMADILDAEARLMRFTPLLAELFDKAAEGYGIIESGLLDIPVLAEKLLPGCQDPAQSRPRSPRCRFRQGARWYL